jgi:hypothetical protein
MNRFSLDTVESLEKVACRGNLLHLYFRNCRKPRQFDTFFCYLSVDSFLGGTDLISYKVYNGFKDSVPSKHAVK